VIQTADNAVSRAFKWETIMKNALAALLALAISGSSALATELDAKAIKETISGRKVVLSTMGFDFPLFYGANGQVTGDGSEVGLSKYFSPKETGRWWVENDKLCQQFPTWYKGKTWCFDLKKVDAKRLNWTRDDGFSGKARITS
jgi:hypothetical protein